MALMVKLKGKEGCTFTAFPPTKLIHSGASLASHYPPIRHHRFPCGLGWLPKAGCLTISRAISASKGGVYPWEKRTAVLRAAPLHRWRKAAQTAGTGEIILCPQACVGDHPAKRVELSVAFMPCHSGAPEKRFVSPDLCTAEDGRFIYLFFIYLFEPADCQLLHTR